MKLKTLKDIKWELDKEYANPPTKEWVVTISTLKIELKKWLKEKKDIKSFFGMEGFD